jgi:lipid-A-disaccharide synthase
MREAGVKPLAQAEVLNVMGIVEVLGALPRIHTVLRTLRAALTAEIDLLVVIDAPDFNIRLAKTAEKRGIPVLFLGAPQVWAWRKKRAKLLATIAAEVLCFFDFEPAHFTREGGQARFVGHPIAQALDPLTEQPTGLALLPGSRPQELNQLLGPMGRIAEAWLTANPGQTIHLARAPGLTESDFSQWDFPFQVHSTVADTMAQSRLALTCSGTATLELACLNRPQVVLYRMNPVSFFLIKSRVDGIEHIALPNLLCTPFVREFIQNWQDEEVLAALETAAAPNAQKEGMEQVRQAVRGGGFESAAERVLYWISKAPGREKTG